MCIKCVKEPRPERHRSCLEQGSYLVNFSKCAVCSKKGFITIKDFVEENEDDETDGSSEQVITYNHHCSSCDHLIADHYYRYNDDEKTQDSLMECVLCGRGADVVHLAKMISEMQQSKHVVLEKAREVVIPCASEIPDDISHRLKIVATAARQKATESQEDDHEWS